MSLEGVKSLYVIFACNFRASKKKGVFRRFTISGDGESRDRGKFCWDNFKSSFFHMREIKMANMRENEMIKHSRNKMTKQAGRQNYIIFDANERKRN